MKFAIYGAGGVGGYFGARLAEAGEEVHFVARGAHLEAIRSEGLKVLSPLGDMVVEPAGATADPRRIGPVDVVLVAVKLYDAEAAEAGCHALVGPRTMVVPLQNGVSAMDAFAAALGDERVLGGIAYIAAHIEAPGVIRHTGTMARLVVGEANGAMTPRVEALWGAFERAGIDAAISPNIHVDIWTKFAFLASFSGVTALTRLPIGPIREDPETRALLHDAVAEVVAVARAAGIGVPENLAERQMKLVDDLPVDMTSSMLHDLGEGKRLELPWLSGTVLRIGREHGVPTPVHAFLHAALKLHTKGRSAGGLPTI